jgi:endonuclease YncB( thermonuclease family)
MEREEECQFVRLLPDGTLVVRIHGVEREVEIEGIETPEPPSTLYVELLSERLPRLGKPLRLIVRAELPNGRIRAKLLYFGWHDKSGDVWLDLALALLDEGVARVADVQFPTREEYLGHEREEQSQTKDNLN